MTAKIQQIQQIINDGSVIIECSKCGKDLDYEVTELPTGEVIMSVDLCEKCVNTK